MLAPEDPIESRGEGEHGVGQQDIGSLSHARSRCPGQHPERCEPAPEVSAALGWGLRRSPGERHRALPACEGATRVLPSPGERCEGSAHLPDRRHCLVYSTLIQCS